jgi:hypothetical protein
MSFITKRYGTISAVVVFEFGGGGCTEAETFTDSRAIACRPIDSDPEINHRCLKPGSLELLRYSLKQETLAIIMTAVKKSFSKILIVLNLEFQLLIAC